MSSREVVFAASSGPGPEQLEAAVDALGEFGDAWLVAYRGAAEVPEFPTRLVFEGADRVEFAERAVDCIKKKFDVEVITGAELEERFGHRYGSKGSVPFRVA
ncbi:hypothetical protein [Gordonia phthalatica]|uniref:hypothetical protein n=1 Tax=Gordonia phthalatica TaxID=1136941 RepID=UPI000A54729B|nr:hypothetical protein [Gordonia phthalatica]